MPKLDFFIFQFWHKLFLFTMLLFLHHLLRRNIIMKNFSKFISTFLLLLTVTYVCHWNQSPITSFSKLKEIVQTVGDDNDNYF